MASTRPVEQFNALINSVHAGIGIADGEENLTFVNSTFAEMLGYSATEIMGASLSQMTTKGEFARFRQLTRQRRNGLRNYYESTLYRRDGSKMDVLISASPYAPLSDRFGGTLGVILDITHLRKESPGTRSTPEVPSPDSTVSGGEIVAGSPGMVGVLDLIRKVAGGDGSVVLQGETGTGKELVARYLHLMSARCGGPFLAVDCGALPDQLLESELFGHERGAFTGAHARKIGLLEAANGGTVLLDEVANLDLGLQSKLLRVLQERCCRRLGGRENIQLDFRLVSASNVDLEQAVDAGRFRRDLYYRLNVIPVKLPPLRERREEILLLAHHFLSDLNHSNGRQVSGFAGEAEETLWQHAWPGNVRELENVVERAFWLAEDGATISSGLLNLPSVEGGACFDTGNGEFTLQQARERLEQDYLRRALEDVGGNVSRAARSAGIHRTSFQRLLNKHGIKPSEFRR